MAIERKSWSVKDEAIHEDLAHLMALSAEEAELLAALHESAKQRATDMAAAFYDRLLACENTKEYFHSQDMERLHGAIATWFSDLFSGQYDSAYVQQRLRIGYVHVRIGLPVRYPIAMLDLVGQYGANVAQTSPSPDAALAAFRKVAALDIAIFNQAYEDSRLQHLAELVGNERLARRLLQN